MKIDGLTPGQGNSAERAAAKRAPATPGKSFADALKKAAQGASEGAAPAAYPAEPKPAASAPAPAGDASAPPSHEDHMSAVRFRMQNGYYDSKKVEDAITEKLSGYFDDLA